MASSLPSITLYTRSGPSDAISRLRIALKLKDIRHKDDNYTYENSPAEYETINPSKTVPTLAIKESDGTRTTIAQSTAALEYLAEAFPSHHPPLMPSPDQAAARAQVRALMNIIVADTHPLITVRVGETLADMFPSKANDQGKQAYSRDWSRHWVRRGLKVYEETVKTSAGKYSVGDEVTLADVCLMPQVWTAVRFGIEMDEYPTVKSICTRLMELEAFGEKAGVEI